MNIWSQQTLVYWYTKPMFDAWFLRYVWLCWKKSLLIYIILRWARKLCCKLLMLASWHDNCSNDNLSNADWVPFLQALMTEWLHELRFSFNWLNHIKLGQTKKVKLGYVDKVWCSWSYFLPSWSQLRAKKSFFNLRVNSQQQ